MTFFNWSRTASSNANADSTINYAEGQAPSSLNDSARAVMAAAAKYRDDIAGAITTAGTSTAYTLTSYQVFDTLAHMSGSMIAFVPHATNGATVTLNVDGLGAKALRSAPSVELPDGALIAGTPYVATYFNATSEWILQGGASNPYSIPLGAGIEYWGTAAPNSAFAFPYGQAISRTTYASLFSLFGTTYGSGDGSTTFNLPDKRGRLSYTKDNLGGSTASRIGSAYGITGTTLGSSGGSESSTIITDNLPAYTPGGTITNGAITTTAFGGATVGGTTSGQVQTGTGSGALPLSASAILLVSSQGTSTFSGNSQGGFSAPMSRLPPGIVCNYILRVI